MKKRIYSIVASLLIGVGFFGINAAMYYSGELESDTVYVVDKGTGVPIIEKNINKKRSPASITKIMTFIVAYENLQDLQNTKIKVTKNVLDLVDPESSGVKLKDGEELSFFDLAHCMLICSSGDAAMVLASHIGGGSVQNFVDMMNKKASDLGCADTHFANPDGFYHEQQYTTAYDVYKITCYAMNISGFLDIVGKSEYSLFGDSRDPIVTTNKMIDQKRGGEYYCPYVKGIKTGYLEEAGKCLVSLAQKDGNSYIGVVMGGPTSDSKGGKIVKNAAMVDTKNILTWAFENLKSVKLYPKESPVEEIGLNFAWRHDKLLLCPESDFYTVLPAHFKSEDIKIKVNAPSLCDAPVERGEIIGNAEVFYQNQSVGTFNVVSSQSFKKSHILVAVYWFEKIFMSPLFLILFVIFIIFVALYVWVAVRIHKRNKRRSKIKRFPINRR